MNSEIFVMVEQKEGEIEESSFGLLSEGKRLNEQLDGSYRVSAIVMGHGMNDLAERFGPYGADQVYFFESQQLDRYHPEIFSDLITKLIVEKAPSFFLLGATALGSDLAPRIAARLEVGLVTHCVDIRANRDKQLEMVKPVSSHCLYQRIVFRNQGLKMVTFSTAAMSRENPDTTRKCKIIRIIPKIDRQKLRTRFIESVTADPKTVSLGEADVIVCGGRGVGRESFEIIYELADAINGSVGGTRPIVDWEILPYERQIGQTGADVSPTVLIACGLSGANEFTAGMEGSRLVIAINIDRTARVFKVADLGLVGDVHEVIPLVIKELRKMKRDGAKGEPKT